MPQTSSSPELVKITIDDQELLVPKGMNVIEAAKLAGVEIPHYCYHPGLSIAGNCRMCQVEVVGAPKLAIGCNMQASEGLAIRTQQSSAKVAEAQQATLEFLLINHPLDCTVCDQAGHCKLQDYHFEYNAKASRFIEDKVHQVKAQPLGPEIVYDGERCIVCTRCVRFCEEVTETGELGVFNRGDKAVIGTAGGRELDNPLAGSVVDLCPVGALTHRRWRFNTRIWYTDQQDTVCNGCSTGCSAKVAVRDGEVVQVKARLNPAVNQEWMCDEGRYGFGRFQPEARLLEPMLTQAGSTLAPASWDSALAAIKPLTDSTAKGLVFLSPRLTLEEVWVATEFAQKVMGLASDAVVMQLVTRELSEVEKKLVSPDYAPNARAAEFFGVSSSGDNWRETAQKKYQQALVDLKSGNIKRVLLVGDDAIREKDVDQSLIQALQGATTVTLTSKAPAAGSLESASSVLLPSRTVNEKSGVFVNKDKRLQTLRALLTAPFGTFADWMLLKRAAVALGRSVLPAEISTDRELQRHMSKELSQFAHMSVLNLGDLGKTVEQLSALGAGSKDTSQHVAERV